MRLARPPRLRGAEHELPPPASRQTSAVDAPRGGLSFFAAESLGAATTELRAARWLVVECAEPSPSGLGAAIDEAVELALAQKGALPPAVELDAGLGRSIADQAFRVRALGAKGLAVVLPRLAALAGTGGLGEADSAAITMWLAAARGGAVSLLADERDRGVQVWSPRPLEDLAAEAMPESGPESRPSAVLPASAEPANDRGSVEPPSAADALFEEIARAVSTDADAADAGAEQDVAATEAAPAEPEEEEAPADVAPPERAPAPPAPARGGPAHVAAGRVVHAAEWRSYAVDLDAARGPRPVSVVEKLFATRYMPLLRAAARGEVDAAVASVIDGFCADFERSYKDGFASLRVTGKRPPMVLDAPEIAGRLARLNGARAVKLLLVDSMRFDLGETLVARLAPLAAGRAVCVERSLLWAALPTRTPTQVALLARGAEGLRDPDLPSDAEPDVARGRAVTTLRRERMGAREVMKIDLVEARLRAGGPSIDERIDAIAVELAEIVAKYIETLPARTLLYVFGDHGFRIASTPDGRSAAATQGGASPEEVLVPAQAWLVGEVH